MGRNHLLKHKLTELLYFVSQLCPIFTSWDYLVNNIKGKQINFQSTENSFILYIEQFERIRVELILSNFTVIFKHDENTIEINRFRTFYIRSSTPCCINLNYTLFNYIN